MEENNVSNMIDELVKKAKEAEKEYMKLDQDTIDNIVKQMSIAANAKHMELACLAVEETKRGVVEDKVTKNIFASEYIYHNIKYDKTVGVIDYNELEDYELVAEPTANNISKRTTTVNRSLLFRTNSQNFIFKSPRFHANHNY